jgi:hypothetical protein
MNETIVVENGQAAVATTSVSGTLSPASSATDTIAIVDTPAGKQAALKVYNLNGGGGGGGEVSGDYLPLSGGTLTGNLNLSGTNFLGFDGKYAFKSGGANSGNITFGDISSGWLNPKIIFSVTGYGALLPANAQATLGDLSDIWKKTYTTIINNGADLIVPTEGGTLARLEDIQNAGGGGAGLPDQTNNAGKFLMTDGENASWGGGKIFLAETALGINATSSTKAVAVGSNTQASTIGAVAVGASSKAKSLLSIAIGCNAESIAENAIQLGSTGSYVGQGHINSDKNTFKVGNANGNFEMMDADGNVPLERLTYVTNQIGDISTALTAILGE